jgi:hypothetical protein
MLEQHSDIYRITAAMKGKTDIIINIAASPIGRALIRSRSLEGHYGTRCTALWSCTHIPIIIDLPRKTKMLWPGQENTIYIAYHNDLRGTLTFDVKVK